MPSNGIDQLLRYSPKEQKKEGIRGFPVLSGVPKRIKEPVQGLFSLRFRPSQQLSSESMVPW
jgi:hypothetical protein